MEGGKEGGMGGGGGGGRVNRNKITDLLRTQNKKFIISFDKYDYGGDLPATDKVLSLKSFPYKMTKQTDGSYFLASSGQRSKSLLFFPSLTSRTSRRFTEKKKKNLLKDHVGFFFLYIASAPEHRDSEVVFSSRHLFGSKYYFFLDGQSFPTNGNELLKYLYTSIRSKM